jgi:2-oxoglutarate ferredoxin oxidoreductase subunit gamma
MQTEIIISGFGGQGVLFAGQLLAYAAMDQGRQVTWIPSYGPEMRGGTANCTIIIADEEIGAPVISHPTAAIVMNLPSLDKYESLVKPGGVLVINTSLVNRTSTRADIKVAALPAAQIAEALGNVRMANIVMLGAFLANCPVLPLGAIEKSIQEHTSKRMAEMVSLNIKALYKGAEIIV